MTQQSGTSSSLMLGGPNGAAFYQVRLHFVDPVGKRELSDDDWRFAEGSLLQETFRACRDFEKAFADEYAAKLPSGSISGEQGTHVALLKSTGNPLSRNHYLVVLAGAAAEDTSVPAFLESVKDRFTTDVTLVGWFA